MGDAEALPLVIVIGFIVVGGTVLALNGGNPQLITDAAVPLIMGAVLLGFVIAAVRGIANIA